MIKRSLATYLKNRAANEALARIARADDDAKGKFSNLVKTKVDIFLNEDQFCIFFSKLVRDIDLILFLS